MPTIKEDVCVTGGKLRRYWVLSGYDKPMSKNQRSWSPVTPGVYVTSNEFKAHVAANSLGIKVTKCES